MRKGLVQVVRKLELSLILPSLTESLPFPPVPPNGYTNKIALGRWAQTAIQTRGGLSMPREKSFEIKM